MAYANEVKEQVLGVEHNTLVEHGAVSEQTVRQMAEDIRRLMHTDFAIATSGIAGPTGGTPDKPVGTVWIAAAMKDRIITMKANGDEGRNKNIENATLNALKLLLKLIQTQENEQ